MKFRVMTLCVSSVLATVACVATKEGADSRESIDAGVADAAAPLPFSDSDASVRGGPANAEGPVAAATVIPRVDGGPVCRARCEKAGCPDVEACVELCAAEAAVIPAQCNLYVAASEACIDEKGSWRCDNGLAKGSGPSGVCVAEAMRLLNCVLQNLDGGGRGGASL